MLNSLTRWVVPMVRDTRWVRVRDSRGNPFVRDEQKIAANSPTPEVKRSLRQGNAIIL